MGDMHDLTAEVSRELAGKLTALQGGRTDAAMAALLGVSRPHWSHIRSGRRRMSYAVFKRASAHFPDLLPIVLRDLASAGAAS